MNRIDLIRKTGTGGRRQIGVGGSMAELQPFEVVCLRQIGSHRNTIVVVAMIVFEWSSCHER